MLRWKWSCEAQEAHFESQRPKRCGGQACQAEGALCRDLEGRKSAHRNHMEEGIGWLGFEKGLVSGMWGE